MTNHAAPTEQYDRVIEDVRQERIRQIMAGHTPERDDFTNRSAHEFVDIALDDLRPLNGVVGEYDRDMLIKGITVLVAAVESWDRRYAWTEELGIPVAKDVRSS